MQIGFVGLGKMGGNMVHRIHRDSEHEVVAFDLNAEHVREAEGHGATGASSLEDLVASSTRRGSCGSWSRPATRRRDGRRARRPARRGRHIVDGGNTNWHDDVRAPPRSSSAASTTSTSAPRAASGVSTSATA